jgi:hypothetical protein
LSPLAARAGRPFYPIRAKRKSAIKYGTQREPAVKHSTPWWMDGWMVNDHETIFSWVSVP